MRIYTPKQKAKLAQNQKLSSGLDIDEFIANVPKKKNQAPMGRAQFKRLVEVTKKKLSEKNWESFKPTDFVMLYAILHERVYGALPFELLSCMKLACLAASWMIRQQFGGNQKRAVDYMRWVWIQEAKSFANRSAENTFRIGWKYQFRGERLITDYRISLQKRNKRT